MKPTSPFSKSRPTGFTLIELLVVIAIIAILASVVSVAAGGAINAAKRAKAANMATQISTAITSYYTEYGTYPTTAAADVILTDSAGEGDLMYSLCGNNSAYNPTPNPGTSRATAPNTRAIAFLTPKKTEVDNNGVPINPMSTTAHPAFYSVAMDADYSGTIAGVPDFSQSSFSSATTTSITQGVGVWACCDPKGLYPGAPGASTSGQFWVHTY